MLYDNCRLLSPQGELLSLIDAKRAKWYIRKNLGTLESEDPLTIRLNFEPSNSTNKEDSFYLIPRENKCVVCGTSEKLTRHHVVPQSFRKHFELSMKSRASHDVLAVCRDCHDEYNIHEDEFRKKLEEEHVHFGEEGTKTERRYVSAARALLNGYKIPTKREDELLELLIDFLGRWPEEEDLHQIAISSSPHLSIGCRTIGEYIVSKLSVEQLNELAIQWRLHFLETMKPRYLPPEWNLHGRARLAEESSSSSSQDDDGSI